MFTIDLVLNAETTIQYNIKHMLYKARHMKSNEHPFGSFYINTLKPIRNNSHITDDVWNAFSWIKSWFSNKIPLKCVLWGLIDNKPADKGLALNKRQAFIEGILPKGPYLPCVSMAGRALLAGYHRYLNQLEIVDQWSTRIPPPHERGGQWAMGGLQLNIVQNYKAAILKAT